MSSSTRKKAIGRRRVCFVTGTRAEFGLMVGILRAIRAHPRLELQLIVTGMHLDASRGNSAAEIASEGWEIDRVVKWPAGADSPGLTAQRTGSTMAGLTKAFEELSPEIVLVAGDRVEAFAAAAAGYVGGWAVAHVHGGDRAEGQVDDTLRHAITKLSHVHLAATKSSAARLVRLGEERGRIHVIGSPGVEGIGRAATAAGALRKRFGLPGKGRYALLVLHPTDADASVEEGRAETLLRAARAAGFEQVVIVYPNNDPGAEGIIACWERYAGQEGIGLYKNLARGDFLGLLRDCAVMAGNSSSGIIEAGSFGIPVIDIGDRQKGRERGENVIHASWGARSIRGAIERAMGKAGRWKVGNPYSRAQTARRAADILAKMDLSEGARRKLITY